MDMVIQLFGTPLDLQEFSKVLFVFRSTSHIIRKTTSISVFGSDRIHGVPEKLRSIKSMADDIEPFFLPFLLQHFGRKFYQLLIRLF